MSILEPWRQRFDAYILKRLRYRPALRRAVADYFLCDEAARAAFLSGDRRRAAAIPPGARAEGQAEQEGRLSFSQTGEDLIAAFIFQALGFARPSYLDLGAYDPWRLSNTARFYLQGARGVNVEPNPAQFQRFLQSRPEDRNLNFGIAAAAGTLTYYVLDAATLNTFSREEAERCVREEGHRILREIPVPVRTLPDVLAEYCRGEFPDFLSVDIEGLDRLVVEIVAAHPVQPKVICLETVSYSRGGQGQKDAALIQALCACGYLVFADTYINTLFVREELWRALK